MSTMGIIDPDKGAHIMIVGRKGQGKSVLARRLFDSFPYSRVVLDVTGDIGRDLTEEGVPYVRLTSPLPVRLPAGESGRPVTALYAPDMGDPNAMDELDRALGLAIRQHKTCAWIDEIGTVTSRGRTPPNLRRGLHHGRHTELTLIMCGPRPMDIDPLCLSQSDHVFVFDLPNPADRKRVADSIGWPPGNFSRAVSDLGDHEFLWWDTLGQELRHMPPLPPARRSVVELRHGDTLKRGEDQAPYVTSV